MNDIIVDQLIVKLNNLYEQVAAAHMQASRDHTLTPTLDRLLDVTNDMQEAVAAINRDEARVTLYKSSGKFYATEMWRVPDDAIGPYDMADSPDFRRIDNGMVVVESDRWGYPHLL